MDKSKARFVLRTCILALFALIVLCIGLAFLSDKLLPTELAEWHQRNAGDDFGFADVFALLFWGGGLFLFLVSMIGLFFYQRWAAWLSAWATLCPDTTAVHTGCPSATQGANQGACQSMADQGSAGLRLACAMPASRHRTRA